MLLLSDADVRACLTMGEAVEAMRDAFARRAAGQMVSAPRSGIEVGGAGLVWTPGGFLDQMTMGLRLYPTGVERGEQLVALWDAAGGGLRCLVLGPSLGRMRTGAIGGVAIDLMAREDAAVLGVIGLGPQAEQQVAAALAVRAIRRIQVFRRDAALRRRTAAAWAELFGVEVAEANGAEEASRGADVVVTATGSRAPVLRAEWLAPGAHVNSLGPKYRGRQEIGVDLARRANLLACDFPEQYVGEADFFLQGTDELARLQDLGALAARGAHRGARDVTLFLSHGLAGTEVRLAQAAYERARALGIGQEIAV